MVTKRRVLFLCIGNSARSQMAEGLTNHFLGDRWEAYSAGTEPAGYVHPRAIEVMAERGVDLSAQRSKSVEELPLTTFDVVITLCDEASEACPVWLKEGHVVHIGFPDPARAQGEYHERLKAFRKVRDAIREKVLGYLSQFP